MLLFENIVQIEETKDHIIVKLYDGFIAFTTSTIGHNNHTTFNIDDIGAWGVLFRFYKALFRFMCVNLMILPFYLAIELLH